jgi:TonB family protein
MAHLGPTLRRTRRREHPAWRALLALAISAALNVLVLTQLDASWLGVGKLAVRRDVTIAPLAAADWEANRAIQPRAPARPALPAPPPPESPGQVVDLGHQPISDRPPPSQTRYVSEHDRVVEKETRARVTGPAQRHEATPEAPPRLAGAGGSSDRSVPGAAGPRRAIQAAVPEPTHRTETPPPAPGETAVAGAVPEPQASGEGGEQRRGDPRLAIPPQTLARLAGLAAPDHLEGVEEGDGTFLNSRSWKYASYFNRIKEAVAKTWFERVDRESTRRDPTSSIYLYKERFTLIEYVLDDKGAVKELAVARSSNVDFLDTVALEAIRSAQPFPNPPTGLIDAKGEVRWTFGFTVTPGREGVVKVYRSPLH